MSVVGVMSRPIIHISPMHMFELLESARVNAVANHCCRVFDCKCETNFQDKDSNQPSEFLRIILKSANSSEIKK